MSQPVRRLVLGLIAGEPTALGEITETDEAVAAVAYIAGRAEWLGRHATRTRALARLRETLLSARIRVPARVILQLVPDPLGRP